MKLLAACCEVSRAKFAIAKTQPSPRRRRIKPLFLVLLIFLSAFHATRTLSMAPAGPPPAANNDIGTHWFKKALWFLAPIVFHVVIKKILVSVVKKYYGNEFYDRAKIKSLIKINQSLKQQLEYIKKNCRDKALVKSMEEKYLQSCIKLMQLQKQYLDTYGKGQPQKTH